MNWLGRIIQKEIMPNDLVLDLGCGIMQATTDVLDSGNVSIKRKIFDMFNYKMNHSLKGNLKCKMLLGCDIWDKYLQRTSERYPTVKLSMNELDKFIDNSYDVVLCLDVLEHLELDLAISTIGQMKRMARKKVIIYTPSEYDDNQEHVSNSWDMGNNQYQTHKSFLNPKLIENLGFKVTFPEPDKNTLGVYNKNLVNALGGP